MKKFFTLAIASLLTVATFAADRKPSVTIQSTKKYEIVIDGKSYFSNYSTSMSIANLRQGYHTVSVYQTNQGFGFRQKKRMMSTATFTLRNNDISIRVDQFGKMLVSESRFGKGNDRGWDNNDKGRGNDRDYGNDDHRNDNDRRF